MRWLLHLVAIVCLTVVAALAAATGYWFLTGGRVYTVQTGSMRPVFRAGDAVLVRPVRAHTIRAGDIIGFHDRQQFGLRTTHRVVAVDQRTGAITTKGDHNPQADLPIQPDQVFGRAVMVAPHLGTVINWLRRPWSLALAVYLPLTVLAGQLIWRWQRQPARTYYRLRPKSRPRRFSY